MIWRLGRGAVLLLFCFAVLAQVIEYENGGQKYQTLTRASITLITSRMTTHLHDYTLFQVAVSNGSDHYWSVRPDDFTFARADGRIVPASRADDAISMLMDRGSHSDLTKLVLLYENALYSIPHMRLSNGYEQRRQAALGEGSLAKFRAAAAASAIALVPIRLAPGQSTDGAVFVPNEGKPAPGRLIAHSNGETFEFNSE